jgi:hypothetical protein
VAVHIAGNGMEESTGDGRLATKAGIEYPGGMFVGPDGDLWICSFHRIRAVRRRNGTIRTVTERLQSPGWGVTIPGTNFAVVRSFSDGVLSKVFADGSVVEDILPGVSGDDTRGGAYSFVTNELTLIGNSGIIAAFRLQSDGSFVRSRRILYRISRYLRGYHLAVDPLDGTIYINSFFAPCTVWRLPKEGGTAEELYFPGLNEPRHMAVDAAGNLFIYSMTSGRTNVFRYENKTRKTSVVFGKGATTPGLDIQLHDPFGIAVEEDGSLVVGDSGRSKVWRLQRR